MTVPLSGIPKKTTRILCIYGSIINYAEVHENWALLSKDYGDSKINNNCVLQVKETLFLNL